jgi:ABC-2 type transport system ATP-binding protein
LLCHRVGIMNKGQLIALGTPADLKARVGDTVVEVPYNSETKYLVFENREKGLQHAATLKENLVIRESSLEDVFVELTGHKVGV